MLYLCELLPGEPPCLSKAGIFERGGVHLGRGGGGWTPRHNILPVIVSFFPTFKLPPTSQLKATIIYSATRAAVHVIMSSLVRLVAHNPRLGADSQALPALRTGCSPRSCAALSDPWNPSKLTLFMVNFTWHQIKEATNRSASIIWVIDHYSYYNYAFFCAEHGQICLHTHFICLCCGFPF